MRPELLKPDFSGALALLAFQIAAARFELRAAAYFAPRVQPMPTTPVASHAAPR